MTSSPLSRVALLFLIFAFLGTVSSKPVRTLKQYDMHRWANTAHTKNPEVRRDGGGGYNGPSGTWSPDTATGHSQYNPGQYTTTGFAYAPAQESSPTPAGYSDSYSSGGQSGSEGRGASGYSGSGGQGDSGDSSN